jgi:DEAD/DEAH box helicase domain-containing protein
MSGIYAYDNYPGGIGLADSLNEKLEGILKAALSLVSSCGCESGCPSCIGALDSRDSLPDNPKTAVAGFLENWIK